jgi:hypothetical protein
MKNKGQGAYSQHFVFALLKSGFNKLECLSLTSLSRLLYCNTLAYWNNL